MGANYCFALTRTSPAISSTVDRSVDGRENRQITVIKGEEADAAAKIWTGFGQAICGFDIVRCGGKSYVIDVNGWTSVKHQPVFYEECASILSGMMSQ